MKQEEYVQCYLEAGGWLVMWWAYEGDRPSFMAWDTGEDLARLIENLADLVSQAREARKNGDRYIMSNHRIRYFFIQESDLPF